MISESARMNSAAEACFRVQAPTSSRGIVVVVALDARSAEVAARLAQGSWNHARFPAPSAINLMSEIEVADLVVMIASPGGGNAEAAAAIGQVCSARRIMTTALITGAEHASDEALSQTLAQLRPWSLMVVIAASDDYVEDVLMALRA
jgi:hypothetical protein